MIFKQVRGRKFSAGQKTIERLYLATIGLIVVPGKFGVLKTSKFPLDNYQQTVLRPKKSIVQLWFNTTFSPILIGLN